MLDIGVGICRSHFRLPLLLTVASVLASIWAGFHGDTGAPFQTWDMGCPKGCRCVNTTGLVNCSNGEWTSIPAMPCFAQHILFENNSLNHLDSTVLSNLTGSCVHIDALSLSGNNITSFARNAFTGLHSLSRLNLERVSENISMFKEIFEDLSNLTMLHHLSLSNNNLGQHKFLPPGFFEPLRNSNLSRLFLLSIRYKHYNHSDFLPLRNLRFLHLAMNEITHVHLVPSDTLEVLDLSHNRLLKMPNFCHGHRLDRPYFKNLRLLYLNANVISRLNSSKLHCLYELRNISLGMNLFEQLEPNTFAGLPKIEHIFLNSMRSEWVTLGDHVFNNTSIRSIFLFNNKIMFPHNVNLGAFLGCANLRYLDIGHNIMDTFHPANFTQLFQHLQSLEYLNMGSSRLQSLPFDRLTFFPNISDIDMSQNEIQDLDGSLFQGLNKLRTFNFSANRIQSLDEVTFRPIFDRLDVINLAFNSFDCDCRLLWFKEYLKANYTRFFDHRHGYTCATPLDVKNSSIASLALSESTCLLPHDVALVIIVCCCVVILLTVAVALRWRYRWHLHFLLLVLERRHSRRRPGAFSHDYYVSADMDSGTDRKWVLQQLMPRLTQFGLHACSAEDTTPGHPELSSALTAMMEQCQRVLFVVSNDYAQSGRCQFELTLALKASLELQRHDITVILLEPVASRYVSSALQVLVKEFTCLPWPKDSADLATARDRFWETLRSALVPRDDVIEMSEG